MKRLILSFVVLVAGAAAQTCPAGRTRVSDTVYGPVSPTTGVPTLFFGDITIVPNSAGTGADGSAFSKLPLTLKITNGALGVCLIPTDTATPQNITYSVTYSYRGPGGAAPDVRETWSVATSGSPLTLADVRLLTTPPLLQGATGPAGPQGPAGPSGVAPSGTGVVEVTDGVPGLVSGAAGNCVKVDGSSGTCGNVSVPGTSGQALTSDGAGGFGTPLPVSQTGAASSLVETDTNGFNNAPTGFQTANWSLSNWGVTTNVGVFQARGVNSIFGIRLFPSGTANQSFIHLHNNSDTTNTNTARFTLSISGSTASLLSALAGASTGVTTQNFGEGPTSGALTSINFQFNGVAKHIMTPTMFTAPDLTVTNLVQTANLLWGTNGNGQPYFQNRTANTGTILRVLPNGSGANSTFRLHNGSDTTFTNVGYVTSQIASTNQTYSLLTGAVGAAATHTLHFQIGEDNSDSSLLDLCIKFANTCAHTFTPTMATFPAATINGFTLFQDATNRFVIQTGTANSATSVAAIPNGTSTSASVLVSNATNLANAPRFSLNASGANANLQTALTGTAATPITAVNVGESASASTLTTINFTFNGVTKHIMTPTMFTAPGLTLSGFGSGIAKLAAGVMGIAAAGDFPQLNQNTTGTAANVTGVVARANGGLNSNAPGTGLLRDGVTPAASELSGDAITSGSNVVSVVKVNGNAPGASCSGQFVRSIDSSARGTCDAIVPSDLPANNRKGGFSMMFRGSDAAAGTTLYITVPYACTITDWAITADSTATIKLWRVADGGTARPTVANSISTSGFAISTGTRMHSTTLTDLSSTAIAAYDTFGVNLFASASTSVEFTLGCQR